MRECVRVREGKRKREMREREREREDREGEWACRFDLNGESGFTVIHVKVGIRCISVLLLPCSSLRGRIGGI